MLFNQNHSEMSIQTWRTWQHFYSTIKTLVSASHHNQNAGTFNRKWPTFSTAVYIFKCALQKITWNLPFRCLLFWKPVPAVLTRRSTLSFIQFWNKANSLLFMVWYYNSIIVYKVSIIYTTSTIVTVCCTYIRFIWRESVLLN